MKLLTEEKRVDVLHLSGLQMPDGARHRAKLTHTRVACTKSLSLLRRYISHDTATHAQIPLTARHSVSHIYSSHPRTARGSVR